MPSRRIRARPATRIHVYPDDYCVRQLRKYTAHAIQKRCMLSLPMMP